MERLASPGFQRHYFTHATTHVTTDAFGDRGNNQSFPSDIAAREDSRFADRDGVQKFPM